MGNRSSRTSRQGGFAYLWALMMVLVMAIYLAEVGDVWQTRSQRAREAELLRYGDEIRIAIKRYNEEKTMPGQYPKSIDDLVQDSRSPTPRHYLRRPYKDPITGEDWSYIAAPGGGFMGVFSKSRDKPLKQANFPTQYVGFADKQTYDEWKFAHWPTSGGGGRR
ncbi:type II secretion system protein [Andreprevotia lacus]|jgi:type II secretory pathway pseudopilin PulG|nr:type II secretion system protein [Andreprevotia lacus]